MSATVTLPLTEWQAQMDLRQEAEKQAANFKRQLIEARMQTGGDPARCRSLNELARNLLSVTRFAVSQLPPESHRNWPARELRGAAQLLPMLNDHDQNDREIASEFQAFADECERWDRARATGYSIVINGRRRLWTTQTISYEEIVRAVNDGREKPDTRLHTITYEWRNAISSGSGSITPEMAYPVTVNDGMIITAMVTDGA